MLAARAALFLLFASTAAFAQTGVDRVFLTEDPRHVAVTGATTWLTVGGPAQLIRIDGSAPATIPLGPAVPGVTRDLASTPGFLWILTSNAIVRYEIATNTATVLHSMAFSAFDRIVVGADGNLWFSRGNQLYRMTIAGAVLSQLTLPFHVSELAATPAAVWAVGGSSTQFLAASTTVVRIALDGSMQTFTLPTAVGLVGRGLGNDVWLSSGLGGQLFHVDEGGNVLDSYLVPRHRTIAAAPNGDVWLAGWDSNVHRIRGRTRTTYLVPTPAACHQSERTAMTIGADGRQRIVESIPPGMFILIPCGLPHDTRPAVVTLDPAQLAASATVPLDPFADIPSVSTLGLLVLAVGLSIGAVFVMHK